MQEILKKHADKLRFLIVGSTNTVLDFGILFSLTIFLNVPKEFANFISTFVAFLFSFFANKKIYFQVNISKLEKTIYFIRGSYIVWSMGNSNNYYRYYYTDIHKTSD